MVEKIITILYLSGDPLSISTIAKILEVTDGEIENSVPELEKALSGVGLSLLHSKNELSIVTKSELSSFVEKFWKEELKGDLTPATLQVLTLVAYLGNGTREQISYIRGVQSAQSIRTLTTRGLIVRNGEICTLAPDALKQLGITHVEELPEYAQLRASLLEKLENKNV